MEEDPMKRWALASLGIAAAVFSCGGLGCSSLSEDCNERRECTGATTIPDASGSSGEAGTAGPAGCVPSENADAAGDACGVFVSSSQGVDSNVGTKERP